MNETVDFSAEVEAEDLEIRREALSQIKDLYEWRKTEKSVKAQIDALDPSASDYGKMGALRRWLFDHAGEDLHDDEAGLVAWLQSAGETEAYDTPNAIYKDAPELYTRLSVLDCFVLDRARVTDCIKKGLLLSSDIAPFKHPMSRTPSLRVDVQENRKR